MATSFIKVLKRDMSSHSERGATMVETSFGIALFLFLILCLFSILWASYHLVVAQFLATEAVRELVVLRGSPADRVTCIRNVMSSSAVVTTSNLPALCPNITSPDTILAKLRARNYALPLASGDITIRYFDRKTRVWWNGSAGTGGDFAEVKVSVNSGLINLVPGIINGVNNVINLGKGLQYNQGVVDFSGSAIGRNEPIVDQ